MRPMAFDPPLIPVEKFSVLLVRIAYSCGASVLRIGKPVADSIVNLAAQV